MSKINFVEFALNISDLTFNFIIKALFFSCITKRLTWKSSC